MRKLPPVEFLHECFNYEAESGELHWKVRPREHFVLEKFPTRGWKRFNKTWSGKIAGNTTDRYRVVGIGEHRNYLVHRIITKLMTGEEPPATIDRIDGDTLNNRWSNLRYATMQEQGGNRRINRNNTSGHRGVSWISAGRKNWKAEIMKNGKSSFLGVFRTSGEASDAYESAAREFHGNFYLPKGVRK